MKLMKQTQVKQNQTRPWNETAFQLKSNELSTFECIKRKEIISNHQDIKMLCKKGIGEERTSPTYKKVHLKVLFKLSTHGIGSGAWPPKLIRNLPRFTHLGPWVSGRQPVPRRGTFFFPGKIGDLLLKHSVDPAKMSHFLTSGHETPSIVINKDTKKRGRLKRKKYPENRQSNICLIKLIFTQSQWISKSWWSKRLTVTQASQGPQKMALPSLRLASARCEEKTLQILDHTCVLYICQYMS